MARLRQEEAQRVCVALATSRLRAVLLQLSIITNTVRCPQEKERRLDERVRGVCCAWIHMNVDKRRINQGHIRVQAVEKLLSSVLDRVERRVAKEKERYEKQRYANVVDGWEWASQSHPLLWMCPGRKMRFDYSAKRSGTRSKGMDGIVPTAFPAE